MAAKGEKAKVAAKTGKSKASKSPVAKVSARVPVVKLTAEIYALSCPKTGAVRYIGKANDSAKRLKSHIRDSRRRNTPVYAWIRKLQSEGLFPTMAVLEVTDDWEEAERRLITLHRQEGKLLNVADGGDEPYCSTEVRAGNGRKVAKLIHDDPYRHAVWCLKSRMTGLLRIFIKAGETDAANRQRDRMRMCAEKRPDICAEWSLI